MQSIVRAMYQPKRNLYALLLLCFFAGFAETSWGQLVSGNLIVEQVGDGTTTLGSAATTVKLLQYSTAGSLVSTSATFGSTGNPTSSPYNLVESGSASSDGYLSLSVDKTFVVVPGYNAPNTTAGIAGTSAGTFGRTIGKILPSGAIQANGTFNTLSGNNYRSVVSNGSGYWLSGGAGVVYTSTDITTGIATTATFLSTTNTRVLNIFNNTLLYSTGSNTSGIYYLGTFGTLPTASAIATTVFATGTGTTPQPYGFSFSPSGLICYVADDRTSGGGIQKWVYSGTFSATTGWSNGTWTLSYTLGTGVTSIGARGLTVDYSGTNPIIYATTAEAGTSSSTLNRLIKITDAGSTSSATTLATAALNYIFRGVAFTPTAAVCTAPTLSTVADLNECSGGTNALSVTATPSTGVTYQWYSVGTKTNSGGSAVTTGSGGTTATYTPPSTTNGTFYYYVVASTGSTCNTTSNVATVTVGTTITLTSASGTNSQVVAPGVTITPIIYAVGNTGTGASISPALPAGLTATYSSGTYTISGAPTAAVTYSYTVTGTGGCGNNPTATGTITASCSLAPSRQDSNITFSGVQNTSITASWTIGGGNGRLVYIQTGSSSFSAPTGTPGTANTVYSGSGTQLVYNGTGNSVTVTGLTTGTAYYFRVYEYTNCSGPYFYNTTTTTNNPNSATAQATVVQSGFTSVITPQYMPAVSNTSDRLPMMFRATVSGLTASTTYRYVVQGATPYDFGGTTTGAGNPLLVSSDGTAYTYVSNPSLNSLTAAGTYETFTTDASGNYTGWFGFVNTGNVRFSVDSTIYPDIRVCDNTTGSVLFLKALNVGVKPLAFSTAATATSGSFFQSVTSATPKNLVALFDNTSLTGRPLYISPVEFLNVTSSGSSYYLTTNLATGYSTASGAWNAIIPNVNANGVRGIEQLSVTTGSLVGCVAKDDDGIWPTGPISTVNPTNGSMVKVINGSDDPLTLGTFTSQPAPLTTYCQNDMASALSVTTSGSVSGLQWYSNTTNTYTGATAILNATGFTYTPPTTTPGTVYYFVQLSNSCGTANSDFAKVVVNPTPTASFAAPAYSSCEGTAAIIIISSTTPGAVVSYTINGGTTQQITLTGTSTTLNSSINAGTYNYVITGVTLNGCTGTTGSTTVVTINSVPVVAAIAGPDYIALGKTGTYTDANTGGTWAITNDPNNSATIQSQSGNPASATVKASTTNVGTPTLTYTITNASTGCSTTVSKTINIFDNTIARYRSAQDGKASDASTWEVLDDNNTYVPATTPPDNNSNIEVRHRVRLETAVFNGSSTSSFKITSHDSSGVTINGKLTIYPTQYFQSNGSVNFNDDSVVLLSDATGTGSIGVMGAAIAGATNVTVQRYTDGKKSTDATGSRRAWRLVTSPVTGQTIRQSWQEGGVSTNGYGTLITGEQLDPATAAAQGYDYIGGGNHTSLKHYVIGGDPSGTGGNYWLPLSNTGSTTGTLIPIQNEQAYLLFVRGDRTVGLTGTSPATLRSTGTLQQGDGHVVALTPNSLYTLVGNPYASAIDFGTFIGHNSNADTGIQDKYYSWNSTIGTYGSYVLVDHLGTGGNYEATPVPLTNGSVQQNDNYRFITNGSGFFVLPNSPTTGGSATSPGRVYFKETDKAPGMVPPISPFRVVTPANERQLLVNLSQKDSDTSLNLADGFRARFSDEYSGNEADNSTAKAANPSENLGLVRSRAAGESDLIIEARADVQKTDTLYMKMWNVSQRSYQLQVQAAGFTTAPGVQAWLQDSYLGTKQAVELAGGITSMDFTVTADSGSWRSDRFMIVFTNSSLTLPVTVTKVKAAAQNGGVSVAWTVTNETNIRTYQAEKSADGGITFTAVGTPQAARNNAGAAMTSYSSFDNQAAAGDNLYRIRIEAKDGTVSYSQTVKVTVGGSGTGVQIVLYPNPVRQGRVSVQLTNLAAGTYLVSVYTSGGGQAVYQKKVTITQAGTTQSEELLLGSTVAQGSYEVKITNHNGAVVHQQQLIVGR